MSEHLKPIKLVFLIVDRAMDERVTDFLNSHGIIFQYAFLGTGTAPTEIRSYWGFSEPEKIVIMSFVPENLVQQVLTLIKIEFDLESHNKGIAFTVPIQSMGDKHVYDIIQENTKLEYKNKR